MSARTISMKAKAPVPAFIEPQLCLLVTQLPEGSDWMYEVKWDGYRAEGIKHGSRCQLMSRNHKSLAGDFPAITKALSSLLCDQAIVDGEIVAFDEEGRPAFQLLQNRRSRASELRFVLFDAMHIDGEDLTAMPLVKRRQRLKAILPHMETALAFSGELHGTPDELATAAEKTGLEGIIAKRRRSQYQPGDRSGSWVKFKTEEDDTFIVGGYLPNGGSFDELIIGVREGRKLRYVASTKAGFVPRTKAAVMEQIRPLRVADCPFFNLPEKGKARWGRSLDAEKMKECRWVRPLVKVRIAFVEWTEARHLRHSRFLKIDR